MKHADAIGHRARVRRLVLPLKGLYFDAIKSGEKTEEYRLHNDYWIRRLEGKTFDEIVLMKGYAPLSDKERVLRRPWRGYEVKLLQHPIFGPDEVAVFAIKVN